MSTRTPKGLLLLLALAAIASTAAATAGASSRHNTAGPITIGISLSFSGDFSDPGKAAKRGYQLWQSVVNAHGGILGRQIR